MATARPTFHESWYRIASLRPRVRATVQIRKQYYRGVKWFVVRDPANNDHFRMNEAGYAFVALLDGRRTVEDAWKICLEKLGDDAPTQGEALGLLGQLYTSNLLCGDLPADCETLFARYKKRRMREIGATLGNLLFIRIPLFDPNRILDGLDKTFGWIFSWVGFTLWVAIVALGLSAIAGRWSDLASQAGNVLDPSNLVFLYLCFVAVKAFHEFGHGLACKHFGRSEGDIGEVHTIGVMLLVFTPMPYVDATSSWSFRDRNRRLIVAAGGMYVEIVIAAIAAMIWAASASGSTVHVLSYNTMFIASVSTLLFNINPLLRYDGYYMLSDILEIPNLYERSKRYLYYLVRRYVWGVENAVSPAHTRGERVWFLPYAVASCIYRVVIVTGILLFVADKLFFIGMILACGMAVMWLVLPAAKFIGYLATSGELARHRVRAVVATVVFFTVLLGLLGGYEWPDRFSAQGIVEPVKLTLVYAGTDGELVSYFKTDKNVHAGDGPLAVFKNPELTARYDSLLAQLEESVSHKKIAQRDNNAAETKIYETQVNALQDQLARVKAELARQKVFAATDGVWLAPRLSRQAGKWFKRGEPVGMIFPAGSMRLRVAVSQEEAARLFSSNDIKVHYRFAGFGETGCGTLEQIVQAGRRRLPSAALGYSGGGELETAASGENGLQGEFDATHNYFEVWVAPDISGVVTPDFKEGRKVTVRFETGRRPLLKQFYRKIMQVFQQRFRQ